MPLQMIRQDITKMKCDAIVNAAKESLLGGGGVDGAIHAAAGPRLLEECRTLGGCRPGEAKITGAYRLPCRYVIHTVGPRWNGGTHGEEAVLRSCYRSSLELAAERGLESVAFPLISAGVFGYPKEEAMRVAIGSIRDFLEDHDMTVYLVVFGKDSYRIGSSLFPEIRAFIDDNYTEPLEAKQRVRRARPSSLPGAGGSGRRRKDTEASGYSRDFALIRSEEEDADIAPHANVVGAPAPQAAMAAAPSAEAAGEQDLAEFLRSRKDESFSQMLLRKIDEAGMTDAECYRRANIDRKHFSKIRSNAGYRPSKPTAVAFAVALRLSIDETRELLAKAGYALSHSSEFDLIIEYYLRQGCYDIFTINEALFSFDQALLGA